MAETIEFACPNGSRAQGHLARAGGAVPGVVVIQEWWGLNDQIRGVAERLAGAGFDALAPDLYGGRVTTEPDEAGHMMDGLDWMGATEQELRGALRHLGATCDKVAVLGFCMGGALAICAGVHLEEVDAAVCFYGIPPQDMADPARLRVPFQGQFASQDDWCTPAAVDALEAKLEAAGVAHELYRYDAKHAFFNEAEAAVYDAGAAALAWDRSLAFLRARLSPG